MIDYLEGTSFLLCCSYHRMFPLGLCQYLEDRYVFSLGPQHFSLAPFPQDAPTPVPLLIFPSSVGWDSSLTITMFIAFVIPVDSSISSRRFSRIASCPLLLIMFYRVLSCSMMTRHVVLISHCCCTIPYALSTQYKVSCHVQDLP